MTTPTRDIFLGLKTLPSCTHPPQVRLLTTRHKACVVCALMYVESLENVVTYFDIQDGPLNDKATDYGLRRQEFSTPIPPQPSIESGG